MEAVTGSEQGRRSFLSSDLFFFLVLVAAVFLAYSNCYDNSFIYDDERLIVHNQFLRSWHHVPTMFTTTLTAGSNTSNTYYRPLQQLWYFLVFQIAGLSTAAFHLANIALHAANTCLMFRLGRKLKFHTAAVFLASMVWAIHPINTEAVTYMSAAADTLYVFFCLWAINALLPDFSSTRMFFGAVLYILALMSKEGAVVFPFLAGGLLYNSSESRFDYRIYYRLWPLVGITIVYIILHLVLSSHQPAPAIAVDAHSDSFLSGFTPLGVYPQYLRLLLWPYPLYMKHVVNAAVPWGPIHLVMGTFIFIVSLIQILRKQTPTTLPLSWGLIWFGVAFLPVASVGDILYEHWMYLPTVGLFLGLAQTIFLTRKVHSKFLTLLISFVVCCGLSYLTWQQNYVWKDAVTFYNNIIGQGGPAPEAHTDLGVYYALTGDYQSALKHYEIADQEFLKAGDSTTVDNRSVLYNDIAMTLLDMPDREAHQDEALRHLLRAIELDPNNYLVLQNLTKVYLLRGDKKNAEYYSDRANMIEKKFHNNTAESPVQ